MNNFFVNIRKNLADSIKAPPNVKPYIVALKLLIEKALFSLPQQHLTKLLQSFET